MFKLRFLARDDVGACTAIRNACSTYPVTTAQFLASWEATLQDPANRSQRLVCTTERGEVVGFVAVGYYAGLPDGLYQVHVMVRPDQRRQGVGRLLYEAAVNWAREAGATELEAYVRGENTEAQEWVQRRGFSFWRERTESVLDLSTWDGSRFAGQVKRVEAQGIRFITLPLAGLEPYLRTLYELESATAPDIPAFQGTYMTYESWVNLLKGTVDPVVFVIALEGDRAVGESVIILPEAPGGQAATDYTGVRREYRGRGIALACKVLTVDVALKGGAATMRTNNDPDNPSMLRVNEKMGYRLVPGPRIYKQKI